MDESLAYYPAPAGWSPDAPNPFAPDGSYGVGWSSFIIVAGGGTQCFTGRSGEGPFVARMGDGVPGVAQRLADFLRYESRHGRQIIVEIPGGSAAFIAAALAATPTAELLRADDPPVIVHATSCAAWAEIQRAGRLQASARLPREEKAEEALTEIDHYNRNEPPEYAEYIMFGTPGTPAPELIVLSKLLGRFCMDADVPYEPGVRLYLDNHRIIRDGLGVRDGLHQIKVHDQLPLAPYLLAAISVADLAPAAWTPRRFTEEADRCFSQR